MPYYHYSATEFEDEHLLVGPAIWGGQSCWEANAVGYDPRRVYVLTPLAADCNPCHLRRPDACGRPLFVYEVRPHGDPLPDPGTKGRWLSESYESAKVVKCVCRPSDHPVVA